MAATDHDGPTAWREAGPTAHANGDQTTSTATIVFLHGLGGTRTAWEPQLKALSDNYRCVAWDMPGYGASAPIENLTFSTTAAAVVALLDDIGVERAHLVGLSLGGMHALHAAINHPDRVDRMVLLDSSPAFGLEGTDPDQWKRLRLDALDRGLTPADMARGVLTSVAGVGLSAIVLDELVASMSRISSAGLRAAVECLPTHDVRSQLREIVAPTCVIVGEHDTETPLSYSQLLAAGIAGAHLEIVEGAGHLSPSEAPHIVNRLIRAHLSTQGDSPP